MNQLQFFRIINDYDLPVFTSKDISRIINKSPDYTKVFLTKVRKNKLLQLIERGKYCKLDTPEAEVASNLLFPSYISFLSALSIHGLTDQIPVEINLVALKQKAPVYFNDYRIKFSTFPKKLFFGYSKQNNMFIAYPEKAIIDSLYLINSILLSEIFKILNESDLDFKKLIDYSIKMHSKILLKRLGYILDVLGIPEHEDLLFKINCHRFDVLNPSLPKVGERNNKWHLQINEDILC